MTPMQRAIELARAALGTTSPNPAVGAVVVKDGVIVGEGHTLPPGQSHAEIVALRQAGEAARGATLYVTLEPCCHFGRTPPCSRAVIAAGVSETHFAVTDPNPRVDGGGRRELEAAGIHVVVGEEAEAAAEIIEGFAKHIRTRQPFVTAKFAMSLDGKIATRSGDSKWVTGPESRQVVQRLRRECDAVLVGLNTALVDDPQLTVRDAAGQPSLRQPRRVVLDSQARTPPTARMLREPGQTIVFVTEAAPAHRMAALEKAGAEVVKLPADASGRVDVVAALADLGCRDVVNLLVEGGGLTLGSLFDAGLVDKVQAFIAPVIIGGQGAASPVSGLGAARMAETCRLERTRLRAIGPDWLITGYPRRGA